MLPLDRGVNFGRRPAQAASAFLTLGLVELKVVGGVELEPLGRVGSVTPWSFKQLRYAAKAALEKLRPPGLFPKPVGRKLATRRPPCGTQES